MIYKIDRLVMAGGPGNQNAIAFCNEDGEPWPAVICMRDRENSHGVKEPCNPACAAFSVFPRGRSKGGHGGRCFSIHCNQIEIGWLVGELYVPGVGKIEGSGTL